MSRLHENTPQIDHTIIQLLKPLVQKLLDSYADKVPEPTRGNTTLNPNTQNLIELRDWFFSHFTCGSREKIFRAAFNFAIIHVDWDRPYKLWFEALLKKAMEMDWEFSDQKPFHWKD